MSEPTSQHDARPADRLADVPRASTRIVVGIDDTLVNWPAVDWAVQEAGATGCPMVVAASCSAVPPSPRTADLDRPHLRELTRELLEDVRSELEPRLANVGTQVLEGPPAHALADFVTADDLLVVGRRVGHPVLHAFEGSTSIAVVGRSPAPVVVVPDTWSSGKSSGPVVAGVVDDRDAPVIEAGFVRAEALGGELLVVRSWEPAAYPKSAEEIREHHEKVRQDMDDLLAAWTARYPTVAVRVECHALSPAVALVSAADGAQLLIVGRRTGTHHVGGLSLTSTPRAVLHHTPCPVLVLPLAESRRSRTQRPRKVLFDGADLPEY